MSEKHLLHLPTNNAKRVKNRTKTAVLRRTLQRVASAPLLDIISLSKGPGATDNQETHLQAVMLSAYKDYFTRSTIGKSSSASANETPFVLYELRQALSSSLESVALLQTGSAMVVDLIIAAMIQEGLNGKRQLLTEVSRFHRSGPLDGGFHFPTPPLAWLPTHVALVRLVVALVFDIRGALIPHFQRIVHYGILPLLDRKETKEATEEDVSHAECIFSAISHIFDGLLDVVTPNTEESEMSSAAKYANWYDLLRGFRPLMVSHTSVFRRLMASVVAATIRKVTSAEQSIYLFFVFTVSTDGGESSAVSADFLAHVILFCMQEGAGFGSKFSATGIIDPCLSLVSAPLGGVVHETIEYLDLPSDKMRTAFVDALSRVPQLFKSFTAPESIETFTAALQARMASGLSAFAAENVVGKLEASHRLLRLCRLLLLQGESKTDESSGYLDCAHLVVTTGCGMQEVLRSKEFENAFAGVLMEFATIIGEYPLRTRSFEDSATFRAMLTVEFPRLTQLIIAVAVSGDGEHLEVPYCFLWRILQGWVECSYVAERVEAFCVYILPHIAPALNRICEGLLCCDAGGKRMSSVCASWTVRCLAIFSPSTSCLLEVDCVVRPRDEALPCGKWLFLREKFSSDPEVIHISPSGPRIVVPEALYTLLLDFDEPADLRSGRSTLWEDMAELTVDKNDARRIIASTIHKGLISSPCTEEAQGALFGWIKDGLEDLRMFKKSGKLYYQDFSEGSDGSATKACDAQTVIDTVYALFRCSIDFDEQIKRQGNDDDHFSSLASTVVELLADVCRQLDEFAYGDSGNLTLWPSVLQSLLLLMQAYVIPRMSQSTAESTEMRGQIQKISVCALRHPHPNVRFLALRNLSILGQDKSSRLTEFLSIAMEIERSNPLYIDELNIKRDKLKALQLFASEIAQAGEQVEIITRFCIGLAYTKFQEVLQAAMECLRLLAKFQPGSVLPLCVLHVAQCVMVSRDESQLSSVLPTSWRVEEAEGAKAHAEPEPVLRALFHVVEKGLLECLRGGEAIQATGTLAYWVGADVVGETPVYAYALCFLTRLFSFHIVGNYRIFNGEKIEPEPQFDKARREVVCNLVRCLGNLLAGFMGASKEQRDAVNSYLATQRDRVFGVEDLQLAFPPFQSVLERLLSWSDLKLKSACIDALAKLEVFPYRSPAHVGFLRSLVRGAETSQESHGGKQKKLSTLEVLESVFASSRASTSLPLENTENSIFMRHYFHAFGRKLLEKAGKSTDPTIFTLQTSEALKKKKDSMLASFAAPVNLLDTAEFEYFLWEVVLPFVLDTNAQRPRDATQRIIWSLVETFHRQLTFCTSSLLQYAIGPCLEGDSCGGVVASRDNSGGSLEIQNHAMALVFQIVSTNPEMLLRPLTDAEPSDPFLLVVTAAMERLFAHENGRTNGLARHLLLFLLTFASQMPTEMADSHDVHPFHTLIVFSEALVRCAVYRVYNPNQAIGPAEIIAQISLYEEIIKNNISFVSCQSGEAAGPLGFVSKLASAESLAQFIFRRDFQAIVTTFHLFLQSASKDDHMFHRALETFSMVTFTVFDVKSIHSPADRERITSAAATVDIDTVLSFLLTYCRDCKVSMKQNALNGRVNPRKVQAIERTLSTALLVFRVCSVFAVLSKKRQEVIDSYIHLFGIFSGYRISEESLNAAYVLDEVKLQIVDTLGGLHQSPSGDASSFPGTFLRDIHGLLSRLPPDHRQKPKSRDILSMNAVWEQLLRRFRQLRSGHDSPTDQSQEHEVSWIAAEISPSVTAMMKILVKTILSLMYSGEMNICTFAAAVLKEMIHAYGERETTREAFAKTIVFAEIMPHVRQLLRDTHGTIRTSALGILGEFARSPFASSPAYTFFEALISRKRLSGTAKAHRANVFDLLASPQVAEIMNGLKRIQLTVTEHTVEDTAMRMRAMQMFSYYLIPFLHANIASILQSTAMGYFITDSNTKRSSRSSGIIDKTTQLQFVAALLRTIQSFVGALGANATLRVAQGLHGLADMAYRSGNSQVCEMVCSALGGIVADLPDDTFMRLSENGIRTLHFLQKRVVPTVYSFLREGKASGKRGRQSQKDAKHKLSKAENFRLRWHCVKLLLVSLRALSKVSTEVIESLRSTFSAEDAENATIAAMRSRICIESLQRESIFNEVLELASNVVALLRSKTNGKRREKARKVLKCFLHEFAHLHIFGHIVKALCSTLRDGYQLHVLSYTLVDLLADCGSDIWKCDKDRADFETFAPDILEILFTHFFGLVGEEKKRISKRIIAKKRSQQDEGLEMRKNRCMEGVTLLVEHSTDTPAWAQRVESKIRSVLGAHEGTFLKNEKRPVPNQDLITSCRRFLEAAVQGIVNRFEKDKANCRLPEVSAMLRRASCVFQHNLAVNTAVASRFEGKYALRGLLQNYSHASTTSVLLPRAMPGSADADGARITEEGGLVRSSFAELYENTFSIQKDIARRDVDFSSTPVLAQGTAEIVRSLQRKVTPSADQHKSVERLSPIEETLSFETLLTMELITEFCILLSWKIFPFIEEHAIDSNSTGRKASKEDDPRRILYDPMLGDVAKLIRKSSRDEIIQQSLKFFVTVLNFSKADENRSPGDLYPSFPNQIDAIVNGVLEVIQRGSDIRRDCYKALTTFVKFAASSYNIASTSPFTISSNAMSLIITSVHSNLIDTKESLLQSGLALLKELLLGILRKIRFMEATNETGSVDRRLLMPAEMVDVVPPILQCMLHTSDGGVQNRCLSILATFISDYVLPHGGRLEASKKKRPTGPRDRIDLESQEDLLQHIFDTLLSHVVRYPNEEAKGNVLRLLNVLLRRLPLDVLQKNTRILLPILANNLVAATFESKRAFDTSALFPEKRRLVSRTDESTPKEAENQSALALRSLLVDRDCWTLCVKDVLLVWLSQDITEGTDVLTTACAVCTELFRAFPEQAAQPEEECVCTKATAAAAMWKCASKLVGVLESVAGVKEKGRRPDISNSPLVFHLLTALSAMDFGPELAGVHFLKIEQDNRQSMEHHVLLRLGMLSDSTAPRVNALLSELCFRCVSKCVKLNEKELRSVTVCVLAMVRRHVLEKECLAKCIQTLQTLIEMAIQTPGEATLSLVTHICENLRKGAAAIVRHLKSTGASSISKHDALRLDTFCTAMRAFAPLCLEKALESDAYPWSVGLSLRRSVPICSWILRNARGHSAGLFHSARDVLMMLHGMSLPVQPEEPSTSSAAHEGSDGKVYILQKGSFSLLTLFGKRSRKGTPQRRHSTRSKRMARRPRNSTSA